MEMGPGTTNPIFLHQLALELHMPVGEMCRRMSAKELTHDWPWFFRWREGERQRAEAKQHARHRQRQERTF